MALVQEKCNDSPTTLLALPLVERKRLSHAADVGPVSPFMMQYTVAKWNG